MPIFLAVFMTRIAISPRFATSSFFIKYFIFHSCKCGTLLKAPDVGSIVCLEGHDILELSVVTFRSYYNRLICYCKSNRSIQTQSTTDFFPLHLLLPQLSSL